MESNSQLAAEEEIRAAARAVREEGFVILRGVIPQAPLRRLRERMQHDTVRLLEERGSGLEPRFIQAPPTAGPHVLPEVVANPVIARLSLAVLGEGAYCNLYSSNTNCPGSADQPLHVDVGQLWPGLEVGHPTATLGINIPLVDVEEETGPTELWPGTHLDTSSWYLVAPEDAERMGQRVRPVLACTQLGDVLVRDLRLWHRGRANRSTEIRHMLMLSHHRFWLERGPRVRFVAGCEAAVGASLVRWHCEFIEALPAGQDTHFALPAPAPIAPAANQ